MRRRSGALSLLLAATLYACWTEANPFPGLLPEIEPILAAYGSYGDMDNAADGLEVRKYITVLSESKDISCFLELVERDFRIPLQKGAMTSRR